MQLDYKTGEWYIPNLTDYIKLEKEDTKNAGSSMLAMGFNDDEESKILFNFN